MVRFTHMNPLGASSLQGELFLQTSAGRAGRRSAYRVKDYEGLLNARCTENSENAEKCRFCFDFADNRESTLANFVTL